MNYRFSKECVLELSDGNDQNILTFVAQTIIIPFFETIENKYQLSGEIK